jgi:hypothetical protein
MEAVNSYVAIYLCALMVVLGGLAFFGRLNQRKKGNKK